jgi:NAD(P)-dependent dehydrogenase (short-subunit alcohol dehydrogenase family)
LIFSLLPPDLNNLPVVDGLLGGGSVYLSFMLIPIFIGIAIFHAQLFDIDLIIKRTLVYGILTACVVGIYVLVAGYLGALFHTGSNLVISLLAYCASKFGLTGFTQALAAEGKAHGIRVCILYPGGMATHWGAWSSTERQARPAEALPVTKALPPAEVASLIVWMAAAPAELVLNEVIISPLEEQGWP